MKTFAIIVGKITLFFGKIFHRGSSLPGKLALKLDKNLLKKLKYPPIRIAVTGSSGKGSTCKIIANALSANGFTVCTNTAGSNLDWGITSCLLSSCTLFGKITADYLVLETDERHAKSTFKYVLPNYVVITNLTKDQPPRNYHIDVIYKEIASNIPKNATIITNMDDPYLRNFEKDFNIDIVYFSLAKNKYSYQNQLFENLNTYHCPYCFAKLKYEYYNFETMGKYNCPKCKFEYISPKILGTNLDLEQKTLTIENKKLKLNGNMLYDAYNTLAAYATLKAIGLTTKNILTGFKNVPLATTHESFITNNKTYTLLNCKCENATTFNQALFKIYYDKTLKDIIIGWKQITIRYPHHDISWLYDISFELLKNANINNIYVIGINNTDLQKRLLLAGLNPKKIIIASSLEPIKQEIKEDKSQTVYAMLNYDYGNPFPFISTFKEDNQ